VFSMKAFLTRLGGASVFFVLFVGFTTVVDAASGRLRRGWVLAIVAFVLGFWLRYSPKAFARGETDH
jgi:membrane protein YqaA with SNARE-associated domain